MDKIKKRWLGKGEGLNSGREGKGGISLLWELITESTNRQDRKHRNGPTLSERSSQKEVKTPAKRMEPKGKCSKAFGKFGRRGGGVFRNAVRYVGKKGKLLSEKSERKRRSVGSCFLLGSSQWKKKRGPCKGGKGRRVSIVKGQR